jgi:DNA-binding transcriptional ArsR family regulator
MSADTFSSIFSALSHPARRAILDRLVQGECGVTELAEPFAMSLPAVSKHLGVLERAGLIARRRDAQWLRCRIVPAGLEVVADFADRYRHLWEAGLDRNPKPPGLPTRARLKPQRRGKRAF